MVMSSLIWKETWEDRSRIGLVNCRTVVPVPGGVMNVLRGLDRTMPSRMMPTPSLLAEPSKPIAITISVGYKREVSTV